MRLIDADAFKNYIQDGLEDVRHFFKDNGKRAEKVIEGICEDIDEQPTIELPQWIPVSEKLPEKDELVLVTVWNDVTIAWRNRDGEWESEGFYYAKGDVTAWMPLPEPWRPGND